MDNNKGADTKRDNKISRLQFLILLDQALILAAQLLSKACLIHILFLNFDYSHILKSKKSVWVLTDLNIAPLFCSCWYFLG